MPLDDASLEQLSVLQDERAILRTLHAYCHAIDYGHEAAWVDLFLETGVFHVEMAGGAAPLHFAGREALQAFIAGHPRAPEALHKHLVLNPLIDVSGDEARVRSYFHMLLECDGLPESFCFGRYLDQMRRCPDGVWRFVERLAEVQSSRPVFPSRAPADAAADSLAAPAGSAAALAPETDVSAEPLRDRRRRETYRRIEQAALELFVERGFEATSIEMIAERAGISRRTFFYYFRSKEDIIHSEVDEAAAMWEGAETVAPGASPAQAAEQILLFSIERFSPQEALVIDRVTRTTPALMERRHYHYACRERSLFAALERLWPDPAKADILRAAAAAAIGLLRNSVDDWSVHDGRLPLGPFLTRGFGDLRVALNHGGEAAGPGSGLEDV